MKPIAVLISDVHYNVHTLPLADAAMRQAIINANALGVTLVVLGDLHDSKANMRGECVNAMIETFKLCSRPPVVMVGNHDRLNEKAPAHALNFLEPYAMVVDQPKYIHPLGTFIPYQHDTDAALYAIPDKDLVFMHQGLTGSDSGEYIQDKSAIPASDIEAKRIISGHYHTRQTINLPNGGTWDYLGNPYTLTYAEANDPPKGFQILYADGSLEFVPTNLRKHVIIELMVGDLDQDKAALWRYDLQPNDLLWLKVTGDKEHLRITKAQVAKWLGIPETFRLDLIPTDTTTSDPDPRQNLSQGPLFDSLIDSLSATSDERKARLKALWKAL